MNFDAFEKKAKRSERNCGMNSAEEMYILQVKVSLPQLWESQ